MLPSWKRPRELQKEMAFVLGIERWMVLESEIFFHVFWEGITVCPNWP